MEKVRYGLLDRALVERLAEAMRGGSVGVVYAERPGREEPDERLLREAGESGLAVVELASVCGDCLLFVQPPPRDDRLTAFASALGVGAAVGYALAEPPLAVDSASATEAAEAAVYRAIKSAMRQAVRRGDRKSVV